MLYSLILTIYFSLFLYLSYKKPHRAVFIILASLPSYAVRFNIRILPMTALEAMVLTLSIAWFVKKISPYFQKKKSPNYTFKISNFQFPIFNQFQLMSIALFILAATISIFISPDKISALGIWKAYFIEPILFLIIFIDVLKYNFTDQWTNSSNSAHTTSKQMEYCHPDRATKEQVEGSVIEHPANPQTAIFNFISCALAIPAIYISLFAIYQKFTGFLVPAQYWQPNYHRVTSFFSYPNAIGLLLAPIAMILFGAAAIISPDVETRLIASLRRWFYSLVIILSLAAIIFAKSEGALIALIAGFFIFAFLYNKKSRIAAGIIIFLILLSGSGIYIKHGKDWNALFSKTNLFELDNACSSAPVAVVKTRLIASLPTKERIKNFQPNSRIICKLYQKITLQDLSGTLRRAMWQETFMMLKDRPIFGAGLSGYQNAMRPYHTKNYVEIYLYPHNIILNFWSETGLLGLMAFIWLIVLFYYYGLHALYIKNAQGRIIPSFEKEPALSDSRMGGEGDFYHRVITITLLSTMSVLLIHGLVDVPYFKNDLAILFWVIWGMMIIAQIPDTII